MSGDLRWFAGGAAIREVVERWATGALGPGETVSLLGDNQRRRLLRLDMAAPQHDGSSGALLLKHFRVATGLHPQRERAKAMLGFTGARREWRSLRRLRERGVAIPTPLGLAELPSGDYLLVLEFVEGTTLDRALPAARRERSELLQKLGQVVAQMHAAGIAHRDLHRGNVLVSVDGPLLLDLQHARSSRWPRHRRYDLGFMDASLAPLLSTADRVRMRAAALDLRRPFGARARRLLRAVGRASRRRESVHAASRTRHCMRPGRRFARVQIGSLRGLRLREFDQALVAEAVDLHRRALSQRDSRVIRSDGRSRVTAPRPGGRAVVVKEVVHGGFGRHLADLFRGSPARRAWRGGHGLIARGVAAAAPLAFLERRSLGLPVASLVVIEDARVQVGSSCALPLDQLAADAGIDASLVDAMVRLLVRLHGSNADHGDLKASHVFAAREAGEWQIRLVDLEGVRLCRWLRDSRRILALAQLNASLPDALAAAERRRALADYARRLPFRRGAELALERIVALSLERADCWTGAGCGVKRPDRAARAPGPDHS